MVCEVIQRSEPQEERRMKPVQTDWLQPGSDFEGYNNRPFIPDGFKPRTVSKRKCPCVMQPLLHEEAELH